MSEYILQPIGRHLILLGAPYSAITSQIACNIRRKSPDRHPYLKCAELAEHSRTTAIQESVQQVCDYDVRVLGS